MKTLYLHPFLRTAMLTKITNMSAYTEEMKKTLLDKCYFIDKMDAKIIVDFGCADGTLLKFIRDIFGDAYLLIGYDNNLEMIELARQGGDGIHFLSQWGQVLDLMQCYKKDHSDAKSAIVLNSVIHEVLDYCDSQEIDEFWGRVWSGDFDSVCVRDMMPNPSIDRCADPAEVTKVRSNANPDKLQTFESIQGPITNNKNLVHYLLKYRYSLNWEREVRENYFPLTTQQYLAMIPDSYCIDYYVEYLLPFIKWKVIEDFGITLNDSTHVKVIARKIK